MSAIHELSSIAVLPQFEIYSVPPTQISVERDYDVEYRPQATLSASGPIEFNIESAANEYINLANTYLKVKLRINQIKTWSSGQSKDSTEQSVSDNDYLGLAPVNYLLHSLFKQIQLYVGGKEVTISPSEYAYKAYLEAFLGYSKNAKETILVAAGWGSETSRKTRMIKMMSDKKGKIFQLVGRLHLDLAFQQRCLLGGQNLKFNLITNSAEFLLNASTGFSPQIELLSCSLTVSKARVTPFLLDAHTKALSVAPAKYPITRSIVKVHTISNGSLDAVFDNLVLGQLPRRMFVGIVSSEAYSGSYKKDPFYFDHFNLNYIVAQLGGEQYPTQAYTPDFANDFYTREYVDLLRALNQDEPDNCTGLTLEEFKNGNVIYGFNFAADLSNGTNGSGHVNPIKRGPLRLYMKFASALTNPVNVVVFLEFDNIIEIDMMRQVRTDY